MARLARFMHLGLWRGWLDAGLGGDVHFSCGTFPDMAASVPEKKMESARSFVASVGCHLALCLPYPID